MKRKSNVFKILIVVVLIAFLGVGVYAIVNTDSEKGSGNDLSVSTFYVNVNNGKKITDHAEGYFLAFDSPLNVDVFFPFGRIDPASMDYSIKIVPTGKVNFEFAVGTSVHTIVSESDLTSMFFIDKQSDSFTVSSCQTFDELLSIRYPGNPIYIDYSSFTGINSDMFRIVVTSGDGSVITIDFSFGILPESISLNSEVIIF